MSGRDSTAQLLLRLDSGKSIPITLWALARDVSTEYLAQPHFGRSLMQASPVQTIRPPSSSRTRQGRLYSRLAATWTAETNRLTWITSEHLIGRWMRQLPRVVSNWIRLKWPPQSRAATSLIGNGSRIPFLDFRCNPRMIVTLPAIREGQLSFIAISSSLHQQRGLHRNPD